MAVDNENANPNDGRTVWRGRCVERSLFAKTEASPLTSPKDSRYSFATASCRSMSKILHATLQDKIEELQSSLDAVGAEAKALSKQNTATEQELQVCPHGPFLCSSGYACSLSDVQQALDLKRYCLDMSCACVTALCFAFNVQQKRLYGKASRVSCRLVFARCRVLFRLFASMADPDLLFQQHQ